MIFVYDILTLSDNMKFHFVYCSLGDLEIVFKIESGDPIFLNFSQNSHPLIQ